MQIKKSSVQWIPDESTNGETVTLGLIFIEQSYGKFV